MRPLFSSLLLSAFMVSCGSPPPAPAPTNPAPSATPTASDSAAASTSAPPTLPAPVALDPALPRDAAWIASVDPKKLLAAIPPDAVSALIEGFTGRKGVTLDSIGIDVSRPITIAQVGATKSEHAALDRLTAIKLDYTHDISPECIAAGANMKLTNAIRIVIPSNDPVATKAAINVGIAAVPLTEKGDGVYESKHSRIVISPGKNAVIVDVGLGQSAKESIESLRAMVTAAHADVPPLEDRALRVSYQPAAVSDLSILQTVDYLSVLPDSHLDPSQSSRICAEIVSNVIRSKDITDHSAFAHVDVSGRVDGPNMSIEARGEPGTSFADPAAAAFEDSPSVTGYGVVGVASASNALVRGFSFPLERQGEPLANSKIVDAMRESPIFYGAAMLPAIVPAMFRLIASRQDGLERGASEHFERTGYLFKETGKPIFFGLLPKTVKGEAAECALAADAKCGAKIRLKMDGVLALGGETFARLLHVKGSTALAVVIASDKETAASVKLTATTAHAFELYIPKHVSLGGNAIDIPILAPGGHIRGLTTLDQRAIVLRASEP